MKHDNIEIWCMDCEIEVMSFMRLKKLQVLFQGEIKYKERLAVFYSKDIKIPSDYDP